MQAKDFLDDKKTITACAFSVSQIGELVKEITEETKIKISKSNKGKHEGKNNGNAKPIICLNDKKIFNTVLDASIYYDISLHSISKVLTGINNNCGKKIGKKLKFKYIVWNHNKKYRIK